MNNHKNMCLALTMLTICLLTNACLSQNSEIVQPVESFSLPKRVGNYRIGRQLIYLTDESRPDSAGTGKREIAVWVYYPAETSQTTAEELILPTAWAERYRALMEKKLGKTAANALLSLKTNAQTAASVASDKSLFPVLIFAPGSNWLPTDYSSMIEDAAASGYIVLAYASAPLSPVVQYSNGSIVDSPRWNESTYGLVGEDFNFICGQLEKLNQDSSLKIKNRLDLDRIGVFGHSLGGAAAILAAANNAQIKAAVNLDGDFSGDSENAVPKQPILYITTQPTSLSDDTPIEKWNEERNEIRRKGIWEKINAQSKAAFRVRIAGMFHTNFQDAALLPPGSMPLSLRTNRYGSIDGERGVKLSTELILKFFDAELNNSPNADFLEIEKKSPEIRIEKR